MGEKVLINRQAAINDVCKMLHECFWADDEELDAVEVTLKNLPPEQPDHSDEAKFWKERAEFYEKTCFDLLSDINKGGKISSIEINENGIIFTKEQKRSCDGCKHLGSITWSDKTARKTKLYCKKSGYLCEFATEHGYCQITMCVKEPLAGRRTDETD